MAIVETVIISPVVDGAVRHHKLLDDFPHQSHADWNLIQEYSDHMDAVKAAQELGPSFRNKFSPEAETGDFGYGVKIPVTIWKNIKETATANSVRPNPYFIGPTSGNVAQLFKLTYVVDQEGIRKSEDLSGQKWSAGVPNPNQTSIHAVVSDAIYITIQGDSNYFTMIGPDKLPFGEMTRTHIKDWSDWQTVQGCSDDFLRDLRSLARTLTRGEDILTYGKAALITAAWQSLLAHTGPIEIQPSREVLRRFSSIMSRDIKKPFYT